MNTVVQRIVITRLVCNFINNSRSLLIVDDLAWNNLGFYVYFGATKNSLKRDLLTIELCFQIQTFINCAWKSERGKGSTSSISKC